MEEMKSVDVNQNVAQIVNQTRNQDTYCNNGGDDSF